MGRRYPGPGTPLAQTVKNLDTRRYAVRHSFNRLRRAISVLGLPALVSACSSLAPHESSLPAGAVPVTALAVYRDWARRTQSCSGLSADLSTVEWYVVPGVETFSTEAGYKVGMWIRESGQNRIVIAGNYQAHEMVVRHEMLHALLGHDGHPTQYFVDRCHLTWESWSESDGTAPGSHGN